MSVREGETDYAEPVIRGASARSDGTYETLSFRCVLQRFSLGGAVASLAGRRPARKRVRKPVEIEIHHRRRKQCQRLADEETADHGVAERLGEVRSAAGAPHH